MQMELFKTLINLKINNILKNDLDQQFFQIQFFISNEIFKSSIEKNRNNFV